MPEDRQFYLDQLKERLHFYKEMGIDGLSVTGSLFNAVNMVASLSHEQPRQAPRGAAPVPKTKASPGLFSLSDEERESLEIVRADLGDCRRCKLCSDRTNIVFGSGTPQAQLMFVGEGPGADEDAQGLPFVGAAGQLLTKIIEAIQLTRDQVYICNIVKCRPPSNRTPEEDEIAACSPFLFRQIESIRPKVICCLGAVAAQTLLGTKTAVGKLRGHFHEYRGIQVMPTWHPAYLLRNPAAKRDVWDDIRKIKALLDEAE
jgi:DNA polymerase